MWVRKMITPAPDPFPILEREEILFSEAVQEVNLD
jgi:hypothetical protein